MEYTNLDFSGDNAFVVFSDIELTVNELVNEPIEVVALYATSDSNVNLTIPFTIVSDAVEGTDYMIVDNKSSFTFSDGNLTDSIFIMPIDENEASGDKVLTFSMNTSNVNVGYPGPDGLNSTLTLTIIDNDCPYTLEELASASWSGSDNSSGSEGPNASQITLAYDSTTDVLTMEGIAYGWLTNPAYWEEVIVDSFPVEVDWDTVTSTFTIAEQDLCTTTWLGDPQNPYSITATGSYDSCGETLTINWDLIQGGGIVRSYTETLTK
jgi:hypothetical protein